MEDNQQELTESQRKIYDIIYTIAAGRDDHESAIEKVRAYYGNVLSQEPYAQEAFRKGVQDRKARFSAIESTVDKEMKKNPLD